MENKLYSSRSLLGKFFHLRPKEYKEISYFFIVFFMLGFALSLSRVISDSLLLSHFGAIYLPIMYLFMGLLAAPVIYFYSWYLGKKSPEALFLRMTAVLAVLSIMLWFMVVNKGFSYVYPILYLFNEITSSLLLIHSFHYVKKNIYFKNETRMLPLVILGIPLGGIVGGGLILLTSISLGAAQFILIWSIVYALLFFYVLAYHTKNGRTPENTQYYVQPNYHHKISSEIKKGLLYTRQSSLYTQLILGIAAAIIATYTLNYLLAGFYVNQFPKEIDLVNFYAWLVALTGSVVFLIQVVSASRLITPLGLRVTNLLPAFALIVGYVILHMSFVLIAAVFASIVKDLSNIVVRTPSYHPFFQSIPYSMQERCRLAIRIVIVPLALISTGGLLLLFEHDFAHNIYLSLGLVVALLYLWANIRSNRAFHSTLSSQSQDQQFIGITYTGFKPGEHILLRRLKRGLDSGIRFVILENAERLLFWFPKTAQAMIVIRLPDYAAEIQIALLELLSEQYRYLKSKDKRQTIDLMMVNERLWTLYHKTDLAEEKCRIMHTLFVNDDSSIRNMCRDLDQVKYPCKDGLMLHQLLEDFQDAKSMEQVDAYFAKLMQSGHENKIAEALLVAKANPLYQWQSDALLLGLNSESEKSRYNTLTLLAREKSLKEYDLNHLYPLIYDASQRVQLESIKVVEQVDSELSLDYLFALMESSMRSEVREYALDRWLEKGGNVDTLKDYLSNKRGYYRVQRTIISQGRVLFDQQTLLCMIKNKINDAMNLRSVLAQLPAFTYLSSDKVSPISMVDENQITLVKEIYSRYAHQQLDDTQTLSINDQFVLLVLNERLEQLTILVLSGLVSLDNQVAIETLLSAIRSKDDRFLPSVNENIKKLHNQELAKPLAKLVHSILRPQDMSTNDANTHPMEYELIDRWCRYNADPWVKQTLLNQKSDAMIDLIDRITLLKKMDIFNEIYTEDMKAIAEALEEDYFTAGDYVFKKGDPSDCSYIIHSGKVGMSVDMEIASSGPLVTLGHGGYFGEMGVLDGHPRAATAYVLEDTRLLCISRKRFSSIIQFHPEIAISILSRMNSIIRDQNRQLYNE